MGAVKGQLVILTHFVEGQNASWQYGVVENVYDWYVHIKKEYGGRYMHVITSDDSNNEYDSLLGKQSSRTFVSPLTSNGKAVIAKKSIFGKYKFEPVN